MQIQGHPERPRLAVYRSNLHIYAQVRVRAYRRPHRGECILCWLVNSSIAQPPAKQLVLAYR